MSRADVLIRRSGWTTLAVLLAALLLGACFYDRSDWPRLLHGEATFLVQADSLAHDFDLAYTRADFDRLLLRWQSNPPDLELASADGSRITFDRPFPYALWLAPFQRLWPRHGFAIANVLLLILVAWIALRLLERSLGPSAGWWVTVWIFASLTFGYAFLATGDLFLFAVVVLALALVDPQAGWVAATWRWPVAGALLAIPLISDPLYGVLPLAVLFTVPGARRGAVHSAFVLGLLGGLTVLVGTAWSNGGGIPWLSQISFRFTPETGFPLVDFTAGEWTASVKRLRALYWQGAPRLSWGLDLWLAGWNAIYVLVGRHFGILPYFAPVLLLFFGASPSRRRAVWLAVAFWVLGLLIFHPFDLAGGEGTLGNGLFLPLYGALLLLPARKERPSWHLAAAAVAVSLLAMPFLWRAWTHPWTYPIAADRGYHPVTAIARSLLPYETSQRWIPAGQAVQHNDLWIRFLNDGGWPETRRDRLLIDGPARVELLIASPLPIDVLRLDFGADAPSRLDLDGGKLGERVLLADGGIAFRVLPRGWSRRHPLWWTPHRQWLYLLALELPQADDEPLAFSLAGERTPPS